MATGAVLCRAMSALFPAWCRAVVAAGAVAIAVPPARAAGPYVFAGSELRELPVSANGRQYLLYIGLPAAYAREPGRRFPVLYCVDGYWDFPVFMPVVGNLRVDGAVPDMFVVGIGYAGENPDYNRLRALDLTPGVDPLVDPAGQNTGRAQQFLAVIEHEIIPFLEREYRVDPSYRVLAGNSYGGLFTAYAAFERPGLFQGYIVSAPSLWWRNRYVAAREDALARAGGTLSARMYLGYGSEDSAWIVDATQAFYRQAAARGRPELAIAIREMEGERHSSLKPEGYTRGLRFTFAPIASRPALTATTERATLVNVSTRGYVGTGDGVLIAGFVVRGLAAKRVLVRAAGPGLAGQGVSGVLEDPQFGVYAAATGAVLGGNDNWEASAEILAAAQQAGAFPLAEGSRDAAAVMTLAPGAYTVVVSGVGATTGNALVEVYELR